VLSIVHVQHVVAVLADVERGVETDPSGSRVSGLKPVTLFLPWIRAHERRVGPQEVQVKIQAQVAGWTGPNPRKKRVAGDIGRLVVCGITQCTRRESQRAVRLLSASSWICTIAAGCTCTATREKYLVGHNFVVLCEDLAIPVSVAEPR